MTRFQKLALLLGALVLILLVGLIAVTALKPTVSISPTSVLSGDDQTATWAIQFLATHAETVQAISTNTYETLNSP